MKYALGDMRLWEMYMRGQIKKESDALEFGTLYDMLLFEKERAFESYLISSEEKLLEGIDSVRPKLTNLYKERVTALKLEAEEEGKTVVSREDWTKANDMIRRLHECGLYNKRLKGKYQVKFDLDYEGVPLKGYLDCLGDGYITDSKSCRSISKFRYDVKSWQYDIQAYIYTKVFGIDDFYWVAQEKAYPYYPAEVKCTEETLFSGEMKFLEALNNIKEYLALTDSEKKATYACFEV
jgi:hypothetical protein